jgi:hypothetical protein
MNLEISRISPVIYHLTNIVMTLCFKDHYVTCIGAQASKDSDGLQTGWLSSSIPPLARHFDYF